jgi:hypothetical protein
MDIEGGQGRRVRPPTHFPSETTYATRIIRCQIEQLGTLREFAARLEQKRFGARRYPGVANSYSADAAPVALRGDRRRTPQPEVAYTWRARGGVFTEVRIGNRGKDASLYGVNAFKPHRHNE